MPKVVKLSSATDIARALQQLGLSVDELADVKAKHTRDPHLAKAVKGALADLSPRDRERVLGAIGDPRAAVTLAAQGGSHVSARLPLAKGGKAPRVEQNVPAVAELLARYGVRSTVPRPLERVLVHMAQIERVLREGTDVSARVDAALTEDLRRYVFLVEGWARLYSRIVPEAQLVETTFKELEDLLGAVSATKANHAYALEHRAPNSVLRLLEREHQAAHAELTELVRTRFSPDGHGRIPAVKSAIAALQEAELHDYVADKKAVRQELGRRLDRIASTPYDMNDLQGGLHELRRQLRWFPIFAEALNGLVQLDPTLNPVKAYEPFLTRKLSTSKYLDLPNDDREVGAFLVSKSLYTALMQLTLDLGALKDAGEPFERLVHALVEVGTAKDLVDGHRLALRMLGGETAVGPIHEDAARFYADMKRNRLVEKLAATFTRTR
jgi:hypothetical protein